MAVATYTGGDQPATSESCLVERLVLGCVWIAIASGAVVFSEPAPVDVLTSGLIVLLPLVGLARPSPQLMLAFSPWLICAAGALLASSQSEELDRSATHSAISIYLYLAAFVLAAFVARRPDRHVRLIMDAYLWAASVAAVAGVIGYFDLLPGAADVFTRFGRAAGTFKDPNVYGAFLATALVYALHRTLHEAGLRMAMPILKLAFLSFAILLSFSRGAWLNAGLAIAIYVTLSLALAPSNRQRAKLVALGMAAFALAASVLVAASQIDGVGKLLSERAAVTQSYDEGPEGRFGGQAKAMGLILEHPFGLGALQFGAFHHHEDVHNVYLSMFLNAGWIGGLTFALMIVLTTLAGLRHLLWAGAMRPVFIASYAAFIATAVEGYVIDIDHWRHLYLLIALLWGLMLAAPSPSARSITRGPATDRKPAEPPAPPVVYPLGC